MKLLVASFGGFCATAEALIEAGTKCIVLVSEPGENPDQETQLGELRSLAAQVVMEQCDFRVESEVEAMLERIRKHHGTLVAVIHTAEYFSDAALAIQDPESIRRVWGPKADAAWFLHKHTVDRDHELGAFISYSSVASLLGSVGQANSTAANAYLDELARWRASQGLPGVSIQWPAVSGVNKGGATEQARSGVTTTIGVSTVKQVLRQVLGVTPALLTSAVQVVKPRGVLEVEVMTSVSSARLLRDVQVSESNS